MRKLPFLVAAQCAAAALGAAPHAGALDHEFQIWNAGTQQVALGNGLELWVDEHARRRSESSLFIVRPALGYRIQPALTVHAGYAWIPTLPDRGDTAHEHRSWQQAVWSPLRDDRWLISLRPRLEQRFSDQGDGVGHRIRLFARLNISPEADPDYLLAIWDEAFYQLNDTRWGLEAGFDQNRFFVGPGFTTRIGLRFEVGYLNVFSNRARDQMAHVLAINGFFSN